MSPKPGKSSKGAKDTGGAGETEVARRLADLKTNVARAAELIAGLREANHALKGEVAELSRKIAKIEAAPPEAKGSPKAETGPAPPGERAEGPASREREQLRLLFQERKTIRRRVESLLERVARLES